MSKDREIKKGNRISKAKVNKEKYIPLFEFLMFDPIYRKMSDKSKILYSFLRKKVNKFEAKQELFEQGEGSKSYVDEKGDLFILADNTELMYLLNCSEPTLITKKKELHEYGLLDEIPVKDKANRIYILEPHALSESWDYIEEIKENREERQKERKEKYKKSKTKEKEKKSDLKNLRYGDLKNLRYGDLKNLSKSQYKCFKSNYNLVKYNINLSVRENIKIDLNKSNLEQPIKHVLEKHIDRLIDLDIQDFESHFEVNKHRIDANEYARLLNKILLRKNVTNVISYMDSTIKNELSNTKEKPKSKEIIPDWFHEQKEKQQPKEEPPATEEDIEELMKQIIKDKVKS